VNLNNTKYRFIIVKKKENYHTEIYRVDGKDNHEPINSNEVFKKLDNAIENIICYKKMILEKEEK
jgi:hypothetical protein